MAATVLMVLGGTRALLAQEGSALPKESLAKWAYEQKLRTAPASKYADFIVMPSLFDKARPDLADLRLRDGDDKEVPYALRIRRDSSRVEVRKADQFNHARLPDRADEVSLDLNAEDATNEIVISTDGTNFRREVRIEGSDRRDGDWKTISEGKTVVRFEAANQTLSSNRVSYPVSRFRYLRVRVFPDKGLPNDTPTIVNVAISQAVREAGEELTLPATLNPRQAVPTGGGPGSAWDIDLGGMGVPCSRLKFVVDDTDFVRDFTLQILPEDPAAMARSSRNYGKGTPVYSANPEYSQVPYDTYGGVIASGQWRRRAGNVPGPLEINFPEVQAHRLRLLVTDNRNQPLTIRSAEFSAAARQVIFEPGDRKGPFKVYFGNGMAAAPNYDLGRNLPNTIAPAPERTQMEGQPEANPAYHPEPPPWTERWPWLIYLVLGAASAVLIGILAILAKEVIRRHDAQEAPPEAASV